MMNFRMISRLLMVGFGLLLVGCEQPTPILVYVTPTPVAQIGALYTPTPGEVEATPIPTLGALATNTPGAASVDDRPVTAAAIDPNATILGPLIGPDYTLPPTETPEPSATPEPDTDSDEPESDNDSDEPEAPEPTDTPTGPEPTAVPNLDPEMMGIQLDTNLTREDWDDAVRRVQDNLSVRWVKVQVSWEAMQPNGPGEFGVPFEQTEQFLQDLDRRGFKIMVSVAKAPAWARSNQNEDGPPDDPQLFANFISFMLTQFETGTGQPVDAIEIWNEPNLQREWQGTLAFSGGGYMQLFGPAYNAVRAYSPTMPIITAGIAPTGDNPGSIDDRSYLRQMYNAGLGNYRDIAIGAHPYSWANSPDSSCCGTRGWDDDPHFFFKDTLDAYKQMMSANGHGDQQIWITEFGWATWQDYPGDPPAGSEWMRFLDECQQAHYTLRAFEIGQSDPRIGPMILWNLNFALLPTLIENRDERIAYSLVIPDQPERPLYWLLFDSTHHDMEVTDQCR